MPAIFYVWETYFPTLREEHKLRLFENIVLRKILGFDRQKANKAEENCIKKKSCLVFINKYSSMDQKDVDEMSRS